MDLGNFPVVGKILGMMAIFNIILTAAKQVCDKVAAGSKADTLLGKACALVAWVLSHVTANTQATPAATPAQAPAAQPEQSPTK